MNIKQMVKELRWKAQQLANQADAYNTTANMMETLENGEGVAPSTTDTISPTPTPPKKKRRLSKAARERIAAAQRLRWAQQKAGKKVVPIKRRNKKGAKAQRAYWATMTAEERSHEMKRRQALGRRQAI